MNRPAAVLIPLPACDFDPTEVAITWMVLREQGYAVAFVTDSGQRSHADPVMLSGRGLDPWAALPWLRRVPPMLGLVLRARRDAVAAYQLLQQDEAFLKPMRFEQLSTQDFQGLMLPGGHAPGMRSFLENPRLHQAVADFFDIRDERGRHKPVAAICHGVVLAARSTSAITGRSVLYGRRTTALPWAMERSAWQLTRFWGRFWDPDYYRTYVECPGEPEGYRSVELEVRRALADERDFVDVPRGTPGYWLKTSGLFRDGPGQSSRAWVVQDGDYLSARWPGDVYTFAMTFASMLADWKDKSLPC